MKIEKRFNENIQFVDDSREIKGYAILFNHESRDLGGFTEIILPQSIDTQLLNESDIKVYLEHNREKGILAR